MKNLLLYFIAFSMLAIFFGCEWINTSPSEKLTVGVDSTLIGTQWNLNSFQHEDTNSNDPGSVGILLEFPSDSTFEGRSYQKADGSPASNSYKGNYSTFVDNKISFEVLGTTKINEPEGSRYLEFLQELQKMDKYQVENKRLMLYQEEEKIMEFFDVDKVD